jgi:hypothetical protein
VFDEMPGLRAAIFLFTLLADYVFDEVPALGF